MLQNSHVQLVVTWSADFQSRLMPRSGPGYLGGTKKTSRHQCYCSALSEGQVCTYLFFLPLDPLCEFVAEAAEQMSEIFIAILILFQANSYDKYPFELFEGLLNYTCNFVHFSLLKRFERIWVICLWYKRVIFGQQAFQFQTTIFSLL